MSEFLILLSIICVPLNLIIWFIKGKKVGKALKSTKTWSDAFFRTIDLGLDIGGTLFIAVLGGGGITSLVIGSIGGLVLSAFLFIFGFTPRD